MLYIPWRDEEIDLIGQDCKQIFLDNSQIIQERESVFVANPNTDYEELKDCVLRDSSANCQELDEPDELDDQMAVFDLQRPEIDLGADISQAAKGNNPTKGLFTSPQLLRDDSYAQCIRRLNTKQREYLLGTMNLLKTSRDPIFHFITGGAGSGKSVLIEALYQSMVRWFNFKGIQKSEKIKDQDPDKPKVLLLGSTGKSAFNIGGTTIHSALGITVSAIIYCVTFRLTPKTL